MELLELALHACSALIFAVVIVFFFFLLNLNLLVGAAAGFFGYGFFSLREAIESRKRIKILKEERKKIG